MNLKCLVKFTRCPVTVETNSNPLWSRAGKLPYLQIANKKFVGYNQIKSFLDNGNYSVDSHLDLRSKNLSSTFTTWVFNQLHPYYHYIMFGDPYNYEITRACYAKRTPFPFNFYYPSSYQKRAQDIILLMAGFDIFDKMETHDTQYLISNAKHCINVLAKRLKNKVWFFGNDYSELDATVYAYLAIISKCRLLSNPMQAHIKTHRNLVNFINRISRDIFQKEAFSILNNSSKNGGFLNDPFLRVTERRLFASERAVKVTAGIGAITAMIAFGAWRGLYKQFSNSRHLQDMFYDNDEDLDDEMN